jgi:HPt (histidine-containing phosphotransfer) domain-containing protein
VSQESASSESPPLDLQAFLRTLRGDATLAAAMAALFLSECPSLLDTVRQAVAAADAQAVEQAAHSLRGSVGNFMAIEATAAAARLEAFGRSGDLSQAASALRALEAAIERLTPALREIAS